MRKKDIFTTVLLLFFGAVALVVMFLFSARAEKYETQGVAVEAVISDIQSEYRHDEYVHYTIVTYEVDGVSYTNKLDTYTSSFYVGKKITIRYMPDNPNQISYTDGTSVIKIVMIGIATFCFVLAVAPIVKTVAGTYKSRSIKTNGRKLVCKITGVDVKSNVTIMGKNPCTITCFDDMGNVYTTKFLCPFEDNYMPGQMVNVYVDRNNPNKYFIELDNPVSFAYSDITEGTDYNEETDEEQY